MVWYSGCTSPKGWVVLCLLCWKTLMSFLFCFTHWHTGSKLALRQWQSIIKNKAHWLIQCGLLAISCSSKVCHLKTLLGGPVRLDLCPSWNSFETRSNGRPSSFLWDINSFLPLSMRYDFLKQALVYVWEVEPRVLFRLWRLLSKANNQIKVVTRNNCWQFGTKFYLLPTPL